MQNKINCKVGGIAGVIAITSYFLAAFINASVQITFLLALLFPIAGIVFIFCIKEYTVLHGNIPVSKLAFSFGLIAFTTVGAMLAVQIAVQEGIRADSAELKLIKQSMRMVDLGLDVAWDMFIGSYLILFCISALKIKILKWWGLVLGSMGALLIILNVSTFPVPPADKGLFDIGPFIAVTLYGLAVHLILLGFKNDYIQHPK